jgi:hypothetical protein
LLGDAREQAIGGRVRRLRIRGQSLQRERCGAALQQGAAV